VLTIIALHNSSEAAQPSQQAAARSIGLLADGPIPTLRTPHRAMPLNSLFLMYSAPCCANFAEMLSTKHRIFHERLLRHKSPLTTYRAQDRTFTRGPLCCTSRHELNVRGSPNPGVSLLQNQMPRVDCGHSAGGPNSSRRSIFGMPIYRGYCTRSTGELTLRLSLLLNEVSTLRNPIVNNLDF
jgi:hypothetical protein